ncbi:MAG: HEAT repeat domain-containing protein [Phycisphaeraceae bacterium]|nr:HEAT repeat domain-containing protein [Phycisphaeraceae bacterium]
MSIADSQAAVIALLAAGMMIPIAVCGCASAPPPSFDSYSPDSRLNAIRIAVQSDDRRAIPSIVSLLDDDDAAVRLYAITSLKYFTGEDLGYDYAAPVWDRRVAVDRWVEWCKVNAPIEGSEQPA